MPNVNLRRLRIVETSKVSNADDRSDCSNIVIDPLSAARETSFSIRSNAVSVLCPRLYADWNLLYTRSTIFEIVFRFETGR